MGLLWIALLVGPTALGAYLVARHGLRLRSRTARGLGTATLTWAWVTFGMQGLGSAGCLGRWPLAAWSLAGLLGGLAVLAAGKRGGEPFDLDDEPAPEGIGWAGAIALGLTCWAGLTFGMPSLLGPVKVVSDGPIYHLYFAVRWWQAGGLILVPTPFGESAAPYFPANGDLILTWLMIGWGGDTLAKVGQAPFLVLAVWAAQAAARRAGAGASAATVAAAWFATSAPLLIFSFEANVDTVFTAGYLVSAWFLLDFARGGSGLGGLLVAGLAAGLAWGTKPTGTVFVPWLLLLGGVFVGRRPGTIRGKAVGLAVLGLAALAPLAFWWGRNLWLTGNPLYPAHLSVLGWTVLPGWYERSAMAMSNFYVPIEWIDILGDHLLTVLDPRMAPVWLLAIAGAWSIGDRRPGRRWVWIFSALAVLNVALFWVAIPYRTQQRFFLQGVGLAVVPLGRLLGRAGWLTWLGVALLAVHLVTPMTWPVAISFSTLVPPQIQPLIVVPLDPRIVLALVSEPQGAAFLARLLATIVGASAMAWGWSRWSRRPTRANLATGLGVSVLAVGLAGAAEMGRATPTGFYPRFPDYQRAWRALERLSPPEGTRVAYVGTNIPYYLFGQGLRNEVRYVAIDVHPGWGMHDYHRTAASRGEPTLWPTPRPGWDRLHPDRAAWLRNLERERIELLVVARAKPEDSPFGLDAEQFPIERRWAESDPERFAPLYGVSPPDPEMRIYRVLPKNNATDSRAGSH